MNDKKYHKVPTVELRDAAADTNGIATAGNEHVCAAYYATKARVGMCCKNLRYAIAESADQMDRVILEDIQFKVEPGKIFAILGSSGSGKTTLLECLLGKATSGHLSGEVLWFTNSASDHPAHIAHVPQTYKFVEKLTVRETLRFAADFQLQGTEWTRAKRTQWVETLMDMLELRPCANVMVGPDQRTVFARTGISGGQRKRLAIGVELVAMPSVLVLDEPTSGLDAACAKSVMDVLSTLSANGCTVVMTLHQPSTDMLHSIHQIMVLSLGRVMYSGEQNKMLDFLHAENFDCPDHTNPAEFVMDISISASANTLVERFKHAHAQWSIDAADAVRHEEFRVDCSPKPQTDALRQFHTLMRRNLLNQFRDPAVFAVRLLMYAALCLLAGSLYFDLNNKDTTIHDRLSMHYFMGSYVLSLTVACIPALFQERAMYLQETSNGHYGAIPYVVAYSVGNIPYLVVITVSCTGILYALVDLYVDPFNLAVYAGALFSALYCAESIMALVSVVANGSMMIGVILAGGSMAIGFLLCGFMKAPSHMSAFWYAVHKMMFQTHYIGIVLNNDLRHRVFEIENCNAAIARAMNGSCIITGSSVLDTFSMNASIDQCFWILLAMSSVARSVFAVLLSLRCRQ